MWVWMHEMEIFAHFFKVKSWPLSITSPLLLPPLLFSFGTFLLPLCPLRVLLFRFLLLGSLEDTQTLHRPCLRDMTSYTALLKQSGDERHRGFRFECTVPTSQHRIEFPFYLGIR